MTANAISAKSQGQLAEEARKERASGVRREACTEYVTVVDGFIDRCRDLASMLGQGISDERPKLVHETYLGEWDRVARACGSVLIAGPADVAECATRLKHATGELSDICDEWYSGNLDGHKRLRHSKFLPARQEAEKAQAAFVAAARAAVFGDD